MKSSTTFSKIPLMENINEACAAIQKYYPLAPQIGITLGSGLGGITELLTESVEIPYSDIPQFHKTSVEGHKGSLVIGKLGETCIALLQGRFHYYEGFPMEDVVFPTRVLCKLGIHTIILTNSAGAIDPRYRPGDLMLIQDHLNLLNDNPLRGTNDPKLGPRFPDMTQAYSRSCFEKLRTAASITGIKNIHYGIYAAVSGPNYETPAEVKMLGILGADVVGMSTVPECIVARHMGVQVAGISCVSNLAAGLSDHQLSHSEVIEVSKQGAAKIKALLKSAIPELAKPDSLFQ